jgi:probable rRNA maturation factor
MKSSSRGGASDPPSFHIDVTATVRGAPAPARIRSWAQALLEEARAPKRRPLSILLCGDAKMRALNREWRKKDKATDVLSFPSDGDALGDLVIDVPYAARQARQRGHSTAREVQVLLAHGVLHLLGHDHETDDGTMFRLQRRLVARVFGPGPDGVPEGEA